ncbi:hypothetical protein [Burkholderia sp. WSM2232]|uniref:hypothetical protein n=1 Tax=Burkholderia sp. WSM2232 TaxID=944436 RepID=UPI0012EB9E22|nr:hypothetical protein [Burkholderia sp. WSM2232]
MQEAFAEQENINDEDFALHWLRRRRLLLMNWQVGKPPSTVRTAPVTCQDPGAWFNQARPIPT